MTEPGLVPANFAVPVYIYPSANTDVIEKSPGHTEKVEELTRVHPL